MTHQLEFMMEVFRYLKLGISVILCFVGVKMLLAHVYKISITVSLVHGTKK